jgi:hypothetical protein
MQASERPVSCIGSDVNGAKREDRETNERMKSHGLAALCEMSVLLAIFGTLTWLLLTMSKWSWVMEWRGR